MRTHASYQLVDKAAFCIVISQLDNALGIIHKAYCLDASGGV